MIASLIASITKVGLQCLPILCTFPCLCSHSTGYIGPGAWILLDQCGWIVVYMHANSVQSDIQYLFANKQFCANIQMRPILVFLKVFIKSGLCLLLFCMLAQNYLLANKYCMSDWTYMVPQSLCQLMHHVPPIVSLNWLASVPNDVLIQWIVQPRAN